MTIISETKMDITSSTLELTAGNVQYITLDQYSGKHYLCSSTSQLINRNHTTVVLAGNMHTVDVNALLRRCKPRVRLSLDMSSSPACKSEITPSSLFIISTVVRCGMLSIFNPDRWADFCNRIGTFLSEHDC